MNCDTFHRKIEDLLDEDCLMDFKNSMEEHRDNCASCKAIYEEELEIQKDFKEFFSIKDIEFKSSRTEIINAINKNQYKNNYLIQIYTHLNRHKNRYMTCAAAFIMLFLVAPNISKLFGFEQLNSDLFKFSSFKSSSSSASATNSMPSQDLAMSYDSGLGNSGVTKSNNVQDTNNITFKKLEMDRGYKVIPRDTWKTSSNGKYSACVDGGTKNTVLGIRKIYVKENATEKLWSFTINNNLDPLNTPLFLEWSQKDKMFMVIVGKATGTITEGGDIYVLNVDSAIASLIYRPAELEKVKSFKGLDGGLSAELIVYEDSKLVKYHMESIKISSESINNMMLNMSTLPKEASIVFEYQENINNNRLEAAIKLISKKHIDGKIFNYNNLLYDIDNMNVTSLKKISSNYSVDHVTESSFQYEAFLAEVNYKLKKVENNSIKSGKNSMVIVLVKDSKDSSWKIGEINVLK